MNSMSRKKIYELSGDNPTLETDLVNERAEWMDLPFEIVLEIYCLLPNRDKFSMALTCKKWRSPFLHPKVWRCSNLRVSNQMDKQKIHTPEHVMEALGSMTVEFAGPRNLRTQALDPIIAVFQTLERIGKNSLESLSIVNLSYCRDQIMLAHLKSMLTAQRELKSLRLNRGILFNVDFVKDLLETVTVNCAHTLRLLEIRDEFPNVKPDRVKLPQFVKRFTRLSEFRTTYYFLTNEVLKSLPATLRKIQIYFDRSHLLHWTNTTSPAKWKMLTDTAPTLRAEYHLTNISSLRIMECVLVPGIPLTTLHWDTQATPVNRIRMCFEHIIKICKDDLKNLILDPGSNILTERDVLSLVNSCQQLLTFSIRGSSTPVSLLAKVEKILVVRRLKMRLQSGLLKDTEIW